MILVYPLIKKGVDKVKITGFSLFIPLLQVSLFNSDHIVLGIKSVECFCLLAVDWPQISH